VKETELNKLQDLGMVISTLKIAKHYAEKVAIHQNLDESYTSMIDDLISHYNSLYEKLMKKNKQKKVEKYL